MNTIRELKQQEKYKNMLKKKNKEKNVYKTQNSTLRIKYEGIKKLLEKKDKEIERLNNIINELEKYIDDYCWANYYEKVAGNRYIKSSILKDIREIIELKGDGSNE